MSGLSSDAMHATCKAYCRAFVPAALHMHGAMLQMGLTRNDAYGHIIMARKYPACVVKVKISLLLSRAFRYPRLLWTMGMR